MEDDFEYHITFPSVTEPGTLKEPVIILFGWAGCVDRHLSKYSEIYEKKGCISVRYVTSTSVLSLRSINQKRIHILAEKVIDLLLDMKFEEHPIYFHVFSNGGATVYRHVSEIIRSQHASKFQIKGCIFDSSPAKVSIAGYIRASLAITEGSQLKKYSVAIIALFRVLLLRIYSSLISLFSSEAYDYRVWDILLKEPNMCPQLFLFSKADNVCNWESIQDFADRRKKKDVNVTTVMWDDSPHVQHLVKHREAYANQVYNFLDENLKPPVDSASDTPPCGENE